MDRSRFLQGTQIRTAKAISSGIKSIILFQKKVFQDQFNEKLKKEEINLIYELIQKIRESY